jgi:hypothetical protein
MIFMNFQRKFCSDSKQNEPHGSFEGHFDPQNRQKSGTFEGPGTFRRTPLGGPPYPKSLAKGLRPEVSPSGKGSFWAVRGSLDPLGQPF